MKRVLQVLNGFRGVGCEKPKHLASKSPNPKPYTTVRDGRFKGLGFASRFWGLRKLFYQETSSFQRVTSALLHPSGALAPSDPCEDTAPHSAAGQAAEPSGSARKSVFICSACQTQMNILVDTAWTCCVCRAAGQLYDRPRRRGAGQVAHGSYNTARLSKAWQCPQCGLIHCKKCADRFRGQGEVPRTEGLTEYRGSRHPTRGYP